MRTAPAAPTPDSATSNVLARLYKSQVVKPVIDRFVENAKKLVSRAAQCDTKGSEQKRQKLENGAEEMSLGKGSKYNKSLGFEGAAVSPDMNIHSDAQKLGGDAIDSTGDEISGDSRINSSDQSSTSDADGDALEAKLAALSRQHQAKPSMPNTQKNNISLSPLSSISRSTSPDTEPSALQPSKPIAKTTESTFIPSLTFGGYVSGSGDDDADTDDDALGQPRKNRRGQRARQAIWEKKYGARARHVVRAHEKEAADRGHGWDPKKGAVEGIGQKAKTARQTRRTRSHTVVERKGPSQRDKKPAGPLHPSWEAARRRKEQDKIPAFQGKRITFD